LKEYLTVGELTNLYNELSEDSSVAKILYSDANDGAHVSIGRPQSYSFSGKRK